MLHVEYKESTDCTAVCSTSGKKFVYTFFTHDLHIQICLCGLENHKLTKQSYLFILENTLNLSEKHRVSRQVTCLALDSPKNLLSQSLYI